MKFSSLAIPTIRGELLHWVRDRTYAMRLSHKMRERWVKGRKLLYRGSSDIEIAKELKIECQEWQEIRKVCSGPPLELKEQAQPTEALEPNEVDFGSLYMKMAKETIDKLGESAEVLNQLEVYLSGTGSRLPVLAVDRLLSLSGCRTTSWDSIEDNLIEGCEDLSNGRSQPSLF